MTSIWENASNLRSMQLPKVREKLSSLVRRGSTRKLRATATGHDGVPTVAPVLEVDLTRVESFRLAEGWLEDPNVEPPPSPPRRNGPNRRKPEPAQRYSTTPIADLFSMSTDQLASMLETVARKPVPAPAPRVVPETWSVAPPLSSTTTVPAAARVAPSRPKTIRQRESIPDASVAPPDLQPIRISLRHSTVVDAVVTPEATSSTQSRRRTVMSWSNDVPAGPPTSSTPEESSSQRHSVRETSLLRSVGPNTTGLRVTGGGTGGGGSNDGTKRFSMPAMQRPPPCANRLPIPETKTPRPTPRNASMPTPTTSTPTLAPSSTTEVRRRSWQPAAAPPPAVQGAAAGSMPRRTPSTRPPTAAPTASRLAWIRALEHKSSSSGMTPRSEPQRLGGPKKQPSGGVAGKLAMFEQMQAPASSISRSNSTTSSRVSSGTAMTDSGVFAAGSAASVVGGDYYPPPSTARTSMDSTRSSYRHSAVMAYYDEEFRERMEGVAGGLSKQANKGEEDSASGGLRKVTAQLVEVARGKKEEDQPREIGAADMSAEDLAKEVQFEERVEEQQVVAPANDDVKPAKQELPETLELPPVLAEELSAGGVKVDSSTPLQVDMSEAQQLAGSSDDVALATTAIGVDEPEAPQPSSTSDEDASATAATDLTRADSEAGKATAENPPSPDAGSVEREHSLMIFEELAENPAQGNIEIAAREEAVEVQIVSGEQDHESARGCSSVVGKDDAGVAVELVVKQQDAARPGVEAEQ